MTNTVLPLSTPITGVDGKLMHSIPVPKGTLVYIAISAANHNKQMWGDDALEFKPERWQDGKADSVTTKLCGVYGNTMTFTGGGRSCMFAL
jgi:cytochrome P450